MTVENTNNTISYTANGSATTFAYNFLTYSAEHIFIYLDDVLQTSGFNITGVGDDNGGDVVFSIAPNAAVIVQIKRIVPMTQLIEYQQYGPFDPKTNERGLDLGVMIDQQNTNEVTELSEKVKRSIKVPINDPSIHTGLIIDDVATRRNRALAFDNDGNLTTADLSITNGSDIFVVKETVTIVNGVLEYTLTNKSNDASALIVDGRTQHMDAYNLSEYTLTLTEPLQDTQKVEIWYQVNALPVNTGDKKGSIGNPWEFDLTINVIGSSEQVAIGEFATTKGDKALFDGKNATYIIVANEAVGVADGYSILNLTDKKAFLLYSGTPLSEIEKEETMNNYSFSYPANQIQVDEMKANVANQSLGYGGSTWHSNPTCIGRKENGVDVIYVGTTYGTPEQPNAIQSDYPANPEDPSDNTLYTNKRNGEAITALTRLSLGTEPSYSAVSFNKAGISYREDEHFQVSVCENTRLGQIITAFGSRNSARDPVTGENKRSFTQITYGQDSNTLADTKLIDWSEEIDGDQMGYAYLMYAGAFGWQFSKAANGDWWSATGSGGQFRAPNKSYIFNNVDKDLAPNFNGQGQTQTYLGLAWVDKYNRPDPRDTDYSRLQVFMFNHPATMADTSVYHLRGSFQPADSGAGDFSGGGIFLRRMSDGGFPYGTTGKLNDEAFNKNQMDLAYTPPAGKSARVLDTAYTDTPRALVGVFNKPQDGDNGTVYGTTWDLVYIYFNGTSWQSTTVKSGIRGMLGYDPNATTTNAAGDILEGKEGFVSGYLNGACFWRGKDWNDTELTPRIFYCGRDGDDRSKHYLAYQDLDAAWQNTSGSEVRLIENSSKILYRPDMALGGDKRVLVYNEADGWSSFNSWVAKTRYLDLTV